MGRGDSRSGVRVVKLLIWGQDHLGLGSDFKQCLKEIKQRKFNNPKRAILMRQEKSRQAALLSSDGENRL